MAADVSGHCAGVRELLRGEEGQADIVLPGVTCHGMDVGRWLARQRQHAVWTGLVDGQRERLEQLGIVPLPPEQKTPTKPSRGGPGAFERGVADLHQYKTRTGTVNVPRGHVEQLDDGTEVKLSVWLSNTKTRRAKLTPGKLAALADLGLDRAAA
ncbi:helicase associated domain-containing protein [Streptomyces inhibens]|uniref:helicase associated domain-containing protein n=1 Tax=Streptomyces inhibens TaxID=2293571 RepID=UPI0036B12461